MTASVPRGDSDRQPQPETNLTFEEGLLHERTRDYGKLPAALMHDKSVSDGAKLLYAHMHWRYGSNQQNFEGRTSIAKLLDVSEATITSRIKELEARDWIVVIERVAVKGQYRTPFYHVFEVQNSARAFRAVYRCKDGETVRKPSKPKNRVNRKGKGGNPNVRVNSSSHGDHMNSNSHGDAEAVLTQVHTIQEQNLIQEQKESSDASNTTLEGRNVAHAIEEKISDGNDTVATRSAEPTPVTAAAREADHTPSMEAVEKQAETAPPESSAKAPPAEPSPACTPTREQRDAMFEAVCGHIFGVVGKDNIREMARSEHSRAGKIVSWLLRQSDGFSANGSKKAARVVVGWISAPAQPEHVAKFAAQYKQKHRDASLPLDIVKFTDAWRAWGSELARENKRKAARAQQAEARQVARPQATPEERAAMKAQLQATRNSLKAERTEA